MLAQVQQRLNEERREASKGELSSNSGLEQVGQVDSLDDMQLLHDLWWLVHENSGSVLGSCLQEEHIKGAEAASCKILRFASAVLNWDSNSEVFSYELLWDAVARSGFPFSSP